MYFMKFTCFMCEAFEEIDSKYQPICLALLFRAHLSCYLLANPTNLLNDIEQHKHPSMPQPLCSRLGLDIVHNFGERTFSETNLQERSHLLNIISICPYLDAEKITKVWSQCHLKISKIRKPKSHSDLSHSSQVQASAGFMARASR